jgi:uncharacterized protein YjbI with pentapeptide repeats
MVNPEHLNILKQGSEAWNKWRSESPQALLDFSGADLSSADLCDMNLANIDFTGWKSPLSKAHRCQCPSLQFLGSRS